MDLDNFEAAVGAGPVRSAGTRNKALSLQAAVDLFDESWYSGRSRTARWMDLIGDYAGMERFVIDGDTLVQRVLEDPMLSMAKENDLSFQLLHALHSLEKLLRNFLDRRAVFDVVFWHCNRHLTCAAGASEHTVASALLARTLLARHLQFNLSHLLEVYTFDNLEDPLWLDYVARQKPMFIMTGDGTQSNPQLTDIGNAAALFQRCFVFNLLSSGLAVSLLRDAEFRQSKIFAFVLEGKRIRNPISQLSEPLWRAIRKADNTLTEVPTGLRLNLPGTEVIQDEVQLDVLLAQIICDMTPHLDSLERAIVLIFLGHCILLDGFVSLQHRGSTAVPSSVEDFERVYGEASAMKVFALFTRVFNCINTIILQRQSRIGTFDLDIHVFLRLLASLSAGDVVNLESLADAVGSAYERLQAVYATSGIAMPDLSALAAFRSRSQPIFRAVIAPKNAIGVLPFDNPVFKNSPLGRLRVVAQSTLQAATPTPPHFSPGLVYSDKNHWHNQNSILPKHQGGESGASQTEWQRKKAMRKEQLFMTSFQRFAESLAGTGVGLRQQVIAAGRHGKSIVTLKTHTPLSVAQSTTKPNGKSTKPAKAKPLTKKEIMLKQIETDKANIRHSDSHSWWVARLEDIAALPSERRLAAAKDLGYNKRLIGADAEPVISLEYQLYMIHLQLQAWISSGSDGDGGQALHDSFTLQLLQLVSKAYTAPGHSTATVAALNSVLSAIGFEAYIPSLSVTENKSEDAERRLSFKFEKLLKPSGNTVHKWMRINEDPLLWQLRVFGEYMDRSLDSHPDMRVPFKPDAWQRKVLNALDADESVLVVAPTSAGKTFISFYAMEKVLRESDNGILVYIAPTKALVNQIAADVHARFRKNRNGKNFWAIHSRDYRVNDPQNCQILITVPEILSIMLLSPALARVWTPRIKRIIMDEIHTIGEQSGGAVWEQILLMAPCPVIGLSATIGEPGKFNDWLAAVQHAHGFKHTYINHPYRHSHLRKHLYLLPQKESNMSHPPFNGIAESGYENTGRTRFMHPVTMIGWGTTTLPPDFALEARDTLTLYQALVQHKARLPPATLAELPRLDPVAFFAQQEPRILRQQDVLGYEAELLRILQPLLTEQSSSVQGSALRDIVAALQDPRLAKADQDSDLNITPTVDVFKQNLIHLAADLHVAGDLPAIFFAFDRSHCEVIVRRIEQDLRSAEKRWKANSPVWAQKLRDFEAWKARAKDRKRAQQQRMAKVKSKRVGADEERGTAAPSESITEWQSSFDPNEPLESFSFAGGNAAYPRSDLETDIKGLAWTSVPKWVIAALRRGIAIHHSGMNKQYRSLVERLFRLKFVRIVVATGTLALGINAPARTTVFCGDSPYLTALMYRQCAGRAGRRGYDLLGKVVFYGLPLDRIQRLVLSRLPPLAGNFPLTSTLSLRLCNLLEGSDRAESAVRTIKSILSLPQIAFGSPVSHDQILHHLRFSIDYLRRMHLLDSQGRPLNLFAVASRLYYCEPSNLALVALLQSGVVHDICNQSSTIDAKQQFMLVMCHLFGRRLLPRTVTMRPKSAGIVVLPPLPEAASQLLQSHGQLIRDIFSGYAMEYALQHRKTLDKTATELPLSSPSITQHNINLVVEGSFTRTLREQSVPTIVRCPFVATSNHGDHFSSVSELTSSAREGLHLNHQAIPSMDMFLASSGVETMPNARKVTGVRAPLRLNAYLFDFYRHGQVEALTTENGVRRGDVWYALDDFSLSLRTVRAALVELLTAPAPKLPASPVESKHFTAAKQTSSNVTKAAEVDWDAQSDDEIVTTANAEDLVRQVPEAPAASEAPESDIMVPTSIPEDESDFSDDDDDAPMHISLGPKPPSVDAKDWRVLQVVNDVVEEFDAAFKRMWA